MKRGRKQGRKQGRAGEQHTPVLAAKHNHAFHAASWSKNFSEVKQLYRLTCQGVPQPLLHRRAGRFNIENTCLPHQNGRAAAECLRGRHRPRSPLPARTDGTALPAPAKSSWEKKPTTPALAGTPLPSPLQGSSASAASLAPGAIHVQ